MNLLTTETEEALQVARGQIGVLRDLLMESLSIIGTIEPESTDESYLLDAFKDQAKAAIEGTKP